VAQANLPDADNERSRNSARPMRAICAADGGFSNELA
jgi:hypothetical protein